MLLSCRAGRTSRAFFFLYFACAALIDPDPRRLLVARRIAAAAAAECARARARDWLLTGCLDQFYARRSCISHPVRSCGSRRVRTGVPIVFMWAACVGRRRA